METANNAPALPRQCKKCGAQMGPDAVLCVNCGYDTRVGMNVKHVIRARKAGRVGLALIVSGIVAFLGAAVWAGIAVTTNMEIGIVAWGIGFLTGLPVVLMTDERSVRTGLAAMGLALAALLCGKLLIVQWGVVPGLAKMLAKEDGILAVQVLARMAQQGDLTEEQREVLKADDAQPEAVEALLNVARDRLGKMSREEKYTLARQVAQQAVAHMSTFEKIKQQSSFFDILWFLLALGTAWKMGTGETGDG